MICELCGLPVQQHARETYRWTSGWTRPASAEPGNRQRAPRLAVEHDERYAHEACIDRLDRGLNVTQARIAVPEQHPTLEGKTCQWCQGEAQGRTKIGGKKTVTGDPYICTACATARGLTLYR